jgi:hypothetical protein
MDNEELRNRVLVHLYNKYYEVGFAQPIDTRQVVLDAGIPSENSYLAYRNVSYLAESSLIKGVKPSGEKYPIGISITSNGIDTVERKHKEFSKPHSDIRFNILANLYGYNFRDHKESMIPIDINFIKSIRLTGSDQNFVIADINYLDDKALIKGFRQIGVPYPYCAQITSRGINTVESVINQSLVSIAKSDTNEKARAEEITHEPNERSKLQKFRDFVGENAGWIELVAM